jgi:hypothetical protein
MGCEGNCLIVECCLGENNVSDMLMALDGGFSVHGIDGLIEALFSFFFFRGLECDFFSFFLFCKKTIVMLGRGAREKNTLLFAH